MPTAYSLHNLVKASGIPIFLMADFLKIQFTVKILKKMRHLKDYRNCPKWNCLVYKIMHPKDADRMTNSVDSDQTAPCWSSLIWVYTVYSDLYVPIFGIFTV